MAAKNATTDAQARPYNHLARLVLTAFLVTFITARIIVFLIMSRAIPDLYLFIGQTHVHHLNYGIFLLAGISFYLLFFRPSGKSLERAATVYGIGLALTFDECGMWLHLGGSYWQRASWDAAIVLAAGFALIAFAPSIKKLRPRHWWTAVILILAIILFFFMLVNSFKYARKVIAPKIEKIQITESQ